MTRCAQSVLLVCAFLVCAYAEAENVVSIKGATQFEEVIANNEFVLVEFYAPWCGHCKKLAPEYEKAATQLKEEGVDIVLASVDATEEENKLIVEVFEIKGYPTLLMYRDNDITGEKYQGPREADGIVSYLKERAGPPSKLLASWEDLDAFVATGAAVIGLFAAESGPEYEAFMTGAINLRDVSFGHVTDASILAFLEMSAPSVLFYEEPKFIRRLSKSTPKLVYSGEWERASLVNFLFLKSLPVVIDLDASPRNEEAISRVHTSNLHNILLVADYSDERTEAVKEAFRAAAVENEGVLHFLQTNSAANDKTMKFFGLTEEKLPALGIHNRENNLKYLETNIKPDTIAEWIQALKDETVDPFFKSEEIPETNDDPVKVVVGKTFQEMVEYSDKDVFIEFYAPWCGHCKKLAPIWEEVAEHFKGNENLVVAKMDATANDYMGSMFNVKGYPTLYFKKAGAEEAIAYDGDRSKDSLIDFVNEHASEKSSKEEL